MSEVVVVCVVLLLSVNVDMLMSRLIVCVVFENII